MNHHHLVLLCFTIFSLDTAYSESKVTINAITEDATKTVYFSVKHKFELKCNSSEEGDIQWEKEENEKWTRVSKISTINGRFKASSDGTVSTYKVEEAVESDAGKYACQFYKDEVPQALDTITVTAKTDTIAMKVTKNINVVEGNTLKIDCLTKGIITGLQWVYENDTYNRTYDHSEDRVKLEMNPKTNVTNGILLIDDIQLYEKGEYTCIATNGEQSINSTATVRVKDKYAALWPFLGICAEVFVLCAIIFIYEKKRNKSELEESDTDQSPDQKNTPDHGKDSNLRHRQ